MKNSQVVTIIIIDLVMLTKKKKRTCRIMDFAIPAHYSWKSKKTKRKTNLTWEMKILWNIKVTLIPVVIGVLGRTPKGLVKGLEVLEIKGWAETIQTTALLKSTRILRRVLVTEQTHCHSNSRKRPSTKDGVKIFQGITIMICWKEWSKATHLEQTIQLKEINHNVMAKMED